MSFSFRCHNSQKQYYISLSFILQIWTQDLQTLKETLLKYLSSFLIVEKPLDLFLNNTLSLEPFVNNYKQIFGTLLAKIRVIFLNITKWIKSSSINVGQNIYLVNIFIKISPKVLRLDLTKDIPMFYKTHALGSCDPTNNDVSNKT